jgi:hypothetical protein
MAIRYHLSEDNDWCWVTASHRMCARLDVSQICKTKQFMQQILGPRQDSLLRFDSAAASHLDHLQQGLGAQ